MKPTFTLLLALLLAPAVTLQAAEPTRAEIIAQVMKDFGLTREQVKQEPWRKILDHDNCKPGGATYPFVIEIEPGELWIGYHNVPKGWNFPRARHLRVSASAVMENVGR